MATIVTRAGKGSPLTHNEVDANFTNLNTAKAELASPALTGTPTAPTAAVGTSTTQIATTAFVNAEIANDIAGKANLASPALTGTPTSTTAAVGTNTTQIATTAFVNAEIANDAPSKTGTGASGTWPISISGDATTVDGKSINTLTAAGGIAYASSTTTLAAIGAGTAGQVLLSGGASAPTWGEATPFFPQIKLIAIQSSTTYTIAAGKRACIIAVGAGGGGGGYKLSSVNDNRTIFGGNGGSAVRSLVTPSSALTLTITIGAGGTCSSTSSSGASVTGTSGSATTVTGTGVNISAAGGAGGYVLNGAGSNSANAASSGGTVFDCGSLTTTGASNRRSQEGGLPFDGGGGTIGGTTIAVANMFGYYSSNVYTSRAFNPSRYDQYPSEMLYARELLIGGMIDEGASGLAFMNMEFGGLSSDSTSVSQVGGTGGIGCGGGGASTGGSGSSVRGGNGGTGYVIILEEA